MGPPQRIRYNTKARGGKSHKKRGLFKKPKKNALVGDAEMEASGEEDMSHHKGEDMKDEDPKDMSHHKGEDMKNEDPKDMMETQVLDIAVPKPAAQKEQEKKERMMKEMMEVQDQSNWNRKRKKKLEAYITKKLKKEERIKLFERLSQSQADIDHLKLQSSSTLGSGRSYTHAHRIALEENHEVRRAMGKRKRLPPGPNEDADSEDSEVDMDGVSQRVKVAKIQDPEILKDDEWKGIDTEASGADHTTEIANRSKFPTAVAASSKTIGAALQRNPDGTLVAPRVVRRKPKKSPRNPIPEFEAEETTDESSATSFDSSVSSDSGRSAAGDSDSNENTGSHSTNEDDAHCTDESFERNPSRTGGFKDWAQKQVIAAKSGAEPEEAATTMSTLPTEYYKFLPDHLRPRPITLDPKEKFGPLGETLVLPNTVLAKHLASKPSEGIDKDSSSDELSEMDTGTPSETQSESDSGEIKTGPKPKNSVTIVRSEEVMESRLRLPILAEEQTIMETVLFNPVTVICGETGSGKTTQVPQFLFEAGFGSPDSDNPGMIGITQPRRVAAMSMASRVAHELSLPADRVSYQIRYDATVSPETSIKFMTDGVLLRELTRDFLLSKYSVIIVDEAHERSMNTDILIGVLSRVLKLREDSWKQGKGGIKPLRLIIMSATLRVADFRDNKTLFTTPPPLINVDTRQFPVTMHYNRRTSHDYMNEVVRKATKIHCRLPPGGILIFLTGQDEINAVCRKLEKQFGPKTVAQKREERVIGGSGSGDSYHSGSDVEVTKGHPTHGGTMKLKSTVAAAREGVMEPDEIDIGVTRIDADELTNVKDNGDNNDIDSDRASEDEADEDEADLDTGNSDIPMHILPLYSLLPAEKQIKVFSPPPIGSRLVVVATNVAETSLTIPGVSYVVDAGRAKQRHHDFRNGIESFSVGWISQASAAQRAGRAGRTGPGHCYRLYSSAFYESHFQKFDEPEILRMPIEGVVLQMKSMHIDAVINFPFPTPPNRDGLRRAEKLLTYLGALENPESPAKVSPYKRPLSLFSGGRITDLGRAMAVFPVSPRYSKMLVVGQQHGCLPYVIALVAAMSVGDPFLREDSIINDGNDSDKGDSDLESELAHIRSIDAREKEARRLKRRAFFKSQALYMSIGSQSDVFQVLSVVGAYEYEGGTLAFCQKHFVRPKAMEEIHKLRAQISYIVQANFSAASAEFNSTRKLPPPSTIQLKALRQFLTAGFIDHVAARKDVVDKRAATGTKVTSSRGVPYRAMDIEEDVFIHPSSIIAQQTAPEWIVYQDVVRTGKVWLKGVTIINPAWLPSLGPSLCTFSKPLELPASAKKLGSELKVVTPHFGPQAWSLPNVRL
ncbi:putative ATP-dependent RNA helicase DHR1 [Tulasnella sp. JGI-2019a]|nr:putative ATP-dependent RNA helicase DHR1 [Tulasnella sp. JGI-2019a]